jgi:diadenosine tetraphosphate (Ap4A) HIT family hydrolase
MGQHGSVSTGWPEDWAARVAGRDCPLCASIGGGDNEHTLAVTTLGHTEVGLERGGALPGYCVVVWRHGHVAEPFELDAASAAGYWADVSAVGRAIAAEFRPVKVNYMTLGN